MVGEQEIVRASELAPMDAATENILKHSICRVSQSYLAAFHGPLDPDPPDIDASLLLSTQPPVPKRAKRRVGSAVLAAPAAGETGGASLEADVGEPRRNRP